ncbi:MAG: septation regulator SpoVG [Clostridia bacterium]|nr:septation regulator SpoVG [Clostridia bacterium]
MRITDVKIRKLTNKNKLRAVMSVTFDDEIAIHDIKIIDTGDRLFVAMPSRKNAVGAYKDIAHPINAQTRRELSKRLIDEYKKACEAGANVDGVLQ